MSSPKNKECQNKDSQDIERCLTGLDAVLNGLGMTNPDDRGRLRPLLQPLNFAVDDYLHRPGEVARHFYFISSGLVRFFYLTEEFFLLVATAKI